MIRIIIGIAIFISLVLFETSFVSSLPGIVSLTPVVFAVSLYLIQHHSFSGAGWWIAVYGILLDIFHVQFVPLETLSYSVAAIIAVLASRHLFSNRSLYGVFACAFLSFLTLTFVQSIFLGVAWLSNPELVAWSIYASVALRRMFMMFVLIVVLFPFAKKIRLFLISTFLLSKRRETL